ncbi:hypothetical protein IWQ57_001883, partial [Coemansia nantahalensis]
MHGRRREAAKEPTAEETAQARQQLARYRALNEKVVELRARGECSRAALEATQQLLEQNTEIHSVWNYRRAVFQGLPAWSDADQRQAMLEEELGFLQRVIRRNIKSYWMWAHRVWVLQSLPRVEWARELALVAKLLAVDARNYHGWNYRRFV